MWVAGFPGNAAPIRRAQRFDGYFPVNLTHPDQLVEAMASFGTGYDVAVAQPAAADIDAYAAVGATWWLTDFDPGVSLDTVRGVLRDGPADRPTPERRNAAPPETGDAAFLVDRVGNYPMLALRSGVILMTSSAQ